MVTHRTHNLSSAVRNRAPYGGWGAPEGGRTGRSGGLWSYPAWALLGTAMCAQGRPATPPFSCCCSGEFTGIYGNLRNLLTKFTGIHGIYGNLLLPDLREFVCGQHAQMNAHGLLYIGGDGAILYGGLGGLLLYRRPPFNSIGGLLLYRIYIEACTLMACLHAYYILLLVHRICTGGHVPSSVIYGAHLSSSA